MSSAVKQQRGKRRRQAASSVSQSSSSKVEAPVPGESVAGLPTPELIRSTILTLVPGLKLAEEKKRSLIVEIQRSDFSQQQTIEYFIGIVGVSAYEAALRGVLSGSLADPYAASGGAGEKTAGGMVKQVIPKPYCQGGDVAYFCQVDLEFETALNDALFGHNVKRTNRNDCLPHSLVDARTVESCIKSKVNSFSVSDKFVASLQQGISILLHQIIRKCVDDKHAQKDVSQDGMITLHGLLGNKKINESHILRVITKMNQDMQLPLRFTEKWENKILQRLISRAQSLA